MDSIGESTSNHMSLDDPSSSDNSPRGISDEPVSRRRNSPEDIDSSRPRKRVAVMEDSTGEITAVFCLTNGDNEQGASAAPNLSPITTEANCAVQTELPLDDDIADFTITKLEKAPVEASSNSTETMNQPLLPSPDTSGSDSDSQTLCSTPRDPDVIEIEDDYDDNPVHPVESTDDIEEISHHTGSGEDAEIVLKRLLGNSEESDLLSENAVEIFVTDGKKFAEILAKKHITLAFLPRILDILVKYNIPFNEALEGMGEAIKQIKTYSGDYVHFSALVISKDTIVLHCAPDQESCVQSPQFLTCIERLVCDDSVMRTVPLEGNRVTNIMLQLRTFLIGPKGLLPNDTELEAFTLDRVIETWQENILLENINGITQQILSMVHRIDSESQVVQEIISTITGYWLTLRDTLYKFFKRDIGTDLKDYREFTQLLEIYTSMASQLHAMQPDNPALEQKLIGYIPYPVGQDLSPRLKVRLQCINSAYRFPIFYEMMRSGRIGDRIHGVTNMTQILLQVFKENQQIGSQSPIVRYFAEFITENGVLEYLIGPDSHETLISRGANIPGYLIATRLVTDKHIDLMWRPFIENENRHLFRALLQMQKEIFPVMQPEVALSMNSRIAKVPLSSFCNGTIDYLNLLVDKIPSLCIPTVQNVIRVMQLVLRHEDAFENQQLISLFTRAEEMLAKLCSKHSDSSLRKDIFRLCVENIRAYNENTTGSLSALNTIFRYRPAPSYRPIAVNAEDDIRWLVEECDFGSLVVEELIHYIDDHRIGNTSFRARQLRIRLDLLALVLLHEPNSIDIEQQEKLWSYLVGHKALGPAERELACERLYYELNEHFKDFQAHPILDMVYRKLLPELDSQFFATPVLELAKKSLEYLNSNPELVSEDSQTVVINGIEVLWRIVLEAPDDSIGNAAISFLAPYLLDCDLVTIQQSETVEATHQAVLNRCIQILSTTAAKLRAFEAKQANDVNNPQSNPDMYYNQEKTQIIRRHLRIFNFLDEFMKGFATRPFYWLRTRETTPESRQMINLTIRLTTSRERVDHNIQIGSQDSAIDLQRAIRKLTSAKTMIVMLGRVLKLTVGPRKTLEELGITDNSVLVVYLQHGFKEPLSTSDSPIMKPDIMEHHSLLFDLLDLPEPLCVRAWTFLQGYRPPKTFIERILHPDTTIKETFPEKSPFKSLYVVFVIGQCVKVHNADEDLTLYNAQALTVLIQRYSQAFCNGILDSSSKNTDLRLYLVSTVLEHVQQMLEQLPEDTTLSEGLPNPEVLVGSLMKTIRLCLEPENEHSQYAGSCAQISSNLLFFLCRTIPEFWTHWMSIDDSRELLIRGLTHKSEAIRTCVASNISEMIAIKGKDFVDFFWPFVQQLLESTKDLDPNYAYQLMTSATATFKFIGESDYQPINYSALLNSWLTELKMYRVNEVVGQPKLDQVVIGLTTLLQLCMHFMNKKGIPVRTNHLEDVWHNVLFPDLSHTPSAGERIPCLHDDVRHELYKTFLTLASSNPGFLDRLVSLNLALFPDDGILTEEFWIERERWLRAPTGLVGLANLSNTCYLNSLFTQLFMNHDFRKFFIELPVDSNDPNRRSLWNVKALFSRMQTTFAKAVEPRDFVESFSDFAGQPIDVQVQMDVDEFFNLLFDRLEREMPSEELKNRFRSFYGGHLVQQVKSMQCNHVSETREPFSAIQCDISGKRTLKESLDAYVEGEILAGDNKYRCSTCDRLVEASRRTCIYDAPDHLLFLLKRFDFDLHTMARSKLNDHFQFPEKIDMVPYTKDYINHVRNGTPYNGPESDIFELVGVLVHTGTADSGHYYSYINNRFSPVNHSSWYEFNDADVSDFDQSTIPQWCFGGEDGITSQGFVLPKAYSAYMLFYQRSSKLEEHRVANPKYSEPSIPPEIRAEVLRENEEIIRRHAMFSPHYCRFVRELIEIRVRTPVDENDAESDKSLLMLALRVMEQICARQKDFPEWMLLADAIYQLLIRSDDCVRTALDWFTEPSVMQNCIMENPYAAIRAWVSRFGLYLLNHYRNSNPREYGLPSAEYEQPIVRERTVLYQFCRAYLDHWYLLQYSIKPWNDYFGVLNELCNRGEIERAYLRKVGFLEQVLKVLIADHMSSASQEGASLQIFLRHLQKPRVPAGRVIDFFSTIMGDCSPFVDSVENDNARDLQRENRPQPLTKAEECYFKWQNPRQQTPNSAVYAKILELPHPHIDTAMSRLTAKILSCPGAPEEDTFIMQIMETLLNNIAVDPASSAVPYLRVLHSFVANTKSQPYITLIVNRVAEELPTIGFTGGQEHLQFFQQLWDLESAERSLKPPILQVIAHWAPALLVYTDQNVRDSAEQFVTEIVFDDPPFVGDIIRQAIKELAHGIYHFIVTKFPSRQPLDETTFTPAMRVLSKCKEQMESDEELEKKLDDLRNFIDNLGLGIDEEEMDDVASDEWNCSDIGSETLEVMGEEQMHNS